MKQNGTAVGSYWFPPEPGGGWNLSKLNALQESDTMGKSEPNPVSVVSISLGDLIPDYAFNARKMVKSKNKDGKVVEEYKGVPEMVDSFKARGQETPCLVRPIPDKPGKYSVVFGFTRLHAARKLGWATLSCQVKPMDDADAGMANLAENMIREDLSPFEIAAACANMRKRFKVDGDAIGKATGKTKSYVNNLMRYFDALHPKLLKLWETGHILMSQENLNTFSAMRKENKEPDHKAQLESLKEKTGSLVDKGALQALRDAGVDIGGGDGSGEVHSHTWVKGKCSCGADEPVKRPNTTQLKRALQQVKKTVKASPSRDAVITTLRWVLGDLRTGIPGFYSPSQDAKSQEEAKAKAKEEAKASKAKANGENDADDEDSDEDSDE